MKKLTGALVLSFSVLLTPGCRSAGESPDRANSTDASTPSGAAEQSPSPTGAVETARGTFSGDDAGAYAPSDTGRAGTGASGVNLGTMKPYSPDAGTGTDAGTGVTQLPAPQRKKVEECVDRWLEARKLDRYGHPEGTMYPGGTPLFDESTGESRDRLEYVFAQQPEAKKACLHPGAGPRK